MYRLIVVFLVCSFSFAQNSKEKAEVYILNHQFTNAENEMLAFLKTNPNDSKAIELLGDAYGYQKKWDAAITQYKVLTEKQPNNADYFYKYGGALGMKALSINKMKALTIIGDVKSAFLKSAALDKNHIDARWALVELYVSLPGIVGGSFSKALKYAEELETLSKVDGYLAKGYVYEYDNEPELAEKYYRLALTVSDAVSCTNSLQNKERNALHYQIGKVCADYNMQLDKGKKCLSTYISKYSAKDGVPKAWAYYRLAQIYKYKKQKITALKWIDKAISSLPKLKVFQDEKTSILKL